MFLATLTSQDVASFSLSFIPSSKFKFFKEGGVTDSVGSTFSLSELRYYGSLKNLGLYSVSVGLEGHGPESEVILLSFFLGVNAPGSFLLCLWVIVLVYDGLLAFWLYSLFHRFPVILLYNYYVSSQCLSMTQLDTR